MWSCEGFNYFADEQAFLGLYVFPMLAKMTNLPHFKL